MRAWAAPAAQAAQGLSSGLQLPKGMGVAWSRRKPLSISGHRKTALLSLRAMVEVAHLQLHPQRRAHLACTEVRPPAAVAVLQLQLRLLLDAPAVKMVSQQSAQAALVAARALPLLALASVTPDRWRMRQVVLLAASLGQGGGEAFTCATSAARCSNRRDAQGRLLRVSAPPRSAATRERSAQSAARRRPLSHSQLLPPGVVRRPGAEVSMRLLPCEVRILLMQGQRPAMRQLAWAWRLCSQSGPPRCPFRCRSNCKESCMALVATRFRRTPLLHRGQGW